MRWEWGICGTGRMGFSVAGGGRRGLMGEEGRRGVVVAGK